VSLDLVDVHDAILGRLVKFREEVEGGTHVLIFSTSVNRSTTHSCGIGDGAGKVPRDTKLGQ
jgi:hypothetical protein